MFDVFLYLFSTFTKKYWYHDFVIVFIQILVLMFLHFTVYNKMFTKCLIPTPIHINLTYTTLLKSSTYLMFTFGMHVLQVDSQNYF